MRARTQGRTHARTGGNFWNGHDSLWFWGHPSFFPSRIQVLRVLLRRVPQHAAARVRGYRRFALEGRPYPAIVREKDAQVIGKVLLDLTPSELRILDDFEGDEYERVTVQAALVIQIRIILIINILFILNNIG